MSYKPPFELNSKIFQLSQEISREIGMLAGAKLDMPSVKLRRMNNIKTIQASLAIEGNTLSLDQVTHIFDGKLVVGPKKDILEVQNAIGVYKNLQSFNCVEMEDCLEAHAILMGNLIPNAGSWRKSGVGIFKGEVVAHMPPPAKRVPNLMRDLFEFLKNDTSIGWLLKGCIFHYELEFIHPFTDGNGRMGRLWQQLILMQEDEVFAFLPVEEIIKQNQDAYYNVLSECDQAGCSTKFIEFSLAQILVALKDYRSTVYIHAKDMKSRLEYAFLKMENIWFSRKDYMQIHPDLSTATASRDLNHGLREKTLQSKGAKNQTMYKFK